MNDQVRLTYDLAANVHVPAARPNSSTIFNILLNAIVLSGHDGKLSIAINIADAAQNAVYHSLLSRLVILGYFEYISIRSTPRSDELRNVASTLGYARLYIGCSAVRNVCAHVSLCRCRMSDSRACEKMERMRKKTGSGGRESPSALRIASIL